MCCRPETNVTIRTLFISVEFCCFARLRIWFKGNAVTDAVFRVRGITKIYPMGEIEVHALRGVDLDLYSREFTVLLGPSGSGKSTLLNILGGLDVPTHGTVHYRQQDLSAASERDLTFFRRQAVGFVFQFYNLIPSLTARENVSLVTEVADQSDDSIRCTGSGRSFRPNGSLPIAAFRGRTAARRDRTCDRKTSGCFVVRRADRRA